MPVCVGIIALVRVRLARILEGLVAHSGDIQADAEDLVVRAALFRAEAVVLAARACRARDQVIKSAYNELGTRWLMFAAQLELEAAERFAESGGRQEAEDHSGLSCAPRKLERAGACALKLV